MKYLDLSGIYLARFAIKQHLCLVTSLLDLSIFQKIHKCDDNENQETFAF